MVNTLAKIVNILYHHKDATILAIFIIAMLLFGVIFNSPKSLIALAITIMFTLMWKWRHTGQEKMNEQTDEQY